MDEIATRRYQLGEFSTTVEIHSPARAFAALLAHEYEEGADECFTIIDRRVAAAHAIPDLAPHYRIDVDESKKSMRECEAILTWLCDHNVHRNATLNAIGGGVTSDLASFVASIYQRGIGLTLYPTTLLAMLDASFGGKTGINYGGFKNMVGSFYPAGRIVIVPEALTTLSHDELINGLAEAIKSAMLGDDDLLQLLRAHRAEIIERRDLGLLREVVMRSLAVKAALVGADFRESDRRALLNLGHTFAHALEADGSFQSWSHGRAVAWGIAQALRLCVALKETDRGYARMIEGLLTDYGYTTHIPDLDWKALCEPMWHDKKATARAIRFIIPCASGKNIMRPLTAERAVELLTRAH